MEPELWRGVLQGGAGVVALLVLVLWLGKGGAWVWARELESEIAERAKDKANYDTALAWREAERAKDEVRNAAEIDRLEREVSEWKHLALESTGLLERAAQKATPRER